MAKSSRGRGRSSRYYLGFGFTALVLTGLTLILVLVVLPRRYVLSAGLRESGVSFPSEAAPFSPPQELLTEAPPPPPPIQEPVRGHAEVFWADVGPLLQAGQHRQAIPLFQDYLAAHPGDPGVLKEYAITLQKAGSPDQAVLIFDRLLSDENDPEIRLLLARGLRDRNRLNEAAIHYEVLLADSPDDPDLALEWGQALAWEEEYTRAARVLSTGLEKDSTSLDLRIALAQVYYWWGKLEEADGVLGTLDEETLRVSGGLPLKREIVAALTPPEPDPEPNPVPAAPLSPRDKIARARAEDDYEKAAILFREALRETPEDTSAWKAFADVLQFGLEDLEGARTALLSMGTSPSDDPALHFRLAQLEIWTGRNDQAAERLQALLLSRKPTPAEATEEETTSFGSAEIAEVQALLGDLQRWAGNRALSGDRYALALDADSTNSRAADGMDDLERMAEEETEDIEAPGLGGNAYSLSDSDDFIRLDLGVEGKTISDHWVWGFRSGTRWLGGFDLTGQNQTDQGLFLELESARWWRWGTIRTGLHFGVEELGPNSTDVSFGASLRFSELWGFRTDARFDHGPAYPLTLTLQSVRSPVTQDRLTLNMARSIGRRWSLSLAGDAAWLNPQEADGTEGKGSLRLEAGASLGRSVSDELVLGMNARAASYSEASPVVDDLRLFWDPEAVFALGFYGQWNQDLSEHWGLSARVNPSLALIDERLGDGFQTVPHFSAEGGLSYQTRRFQTRMDAFYYQGRFDGYRAYGLQFSVRARDWFRKEESR